MKISDHTRVARLGKYDQKVILLPLHGESYI